MYQTERLTYAGHNRYGYEHLTYTVKIGTDLNYFEVASKLALY